MSKVAFCGVAPQLKLAKPEFRPLSFQDFKPSLELFESGRASVQEESQQVLSLMTKVADDFDLRAASTYTPEDVQLVGEIIHIRFRTIIHTHLAALALFVNTSSIVKDLQICLNDAVDSQRMYGIVFEHLKKTQLTWEVMRDQAKQSLNKFLGSFDILVGSLRHQMENIHTTAELNHEDEPNAIFSGSLKKKSEKFCSIREMLRNDTFVDQFDVRHISLFYDAVELYAHDEGNKDKRVQAEGIYADFLAESAPKKIALFIGTRQAVSSQLKHGAPGLFQPAIEEVDLSLIVPLVTFCNLFNPVIDEKPLGELRFKLPKVLDRIETPKIQDLTDIYSAFFMASPCFYFILCNGTASGKNDEPEQGGSWSDASMEYVGIFVIRQQPVLQNIGTFDLGPVNHCLLLDKNGTHRVSVPTSCIMDSGISGFNKPKQLEKYLDSLITDDKRFQCIIGSDEEMKAVSKDIRDIGRRHGDLISAMKIAVLYVKPEDKTMDDIFANQPPANSKFFSFLNHMAVRMPIATWPNGKFRGDIGKEGDDANMDTYYTVWRDIEIMFHVAPWLNKEQHRRLVGNDICVIIYYEDLERPANPRPFVPEPLHGIGAVPQVFAVVSPVQGVHRLSYLQGTNLKEFEPSAPPRDYGLDDGSLREYLFTTLHNGLDQAFKCPPLLRLKVVPRSRAIRDFGLKYINMTGKSGERAYDKALTEKTKELERSKTKTIGLKNISEPVPTLLLHTPAPNEPQSCSPVEKKGGLALLSVTMDKKESGTGRSPRRGSGLKQDKKDKEDKKEKEKDKKTKDKEAKKIGQTL